MIADYRDIHKGETALIIGNGPSLDKTPLEQLAKKYRSFGANKIFNYPFTPDYYTAVDLDMLHSCLPLPVEFKPKAVFVPRGIPLAGSERLPIAIDAKFSEDAESVVYLGGTVTFVNMQLAYYMGFERLLIVGLDHRYDKAGQGKPGSKFIADGGDPDHFRGKNNKDYFEGGRLYNRPELDTVERRIFPLANRAFNGNIVNLTPGTASQAFKLGEFKDWI